MGDPKQDHLRRRLFASVTRTQTFGVRNVTLAVLPHAINALLWCRDKPVLGFADLTGDHTADLEAVARMAERIEERCFNIALKGLIQDIGKRAKV